MRTLVYRRGASAMYRGLLAIGAVAVLLAACGPSTPPPSASSGPVAPATLELQVRNSGLPGGYVWVARADDPGSFRWHGIGMAEYICVTCPVPFEGSTAGFIVAILDKNCAGHGIVRLTPGAHLVAVDPGPTVTATTPPVGGDWLPVDSQPLAVGSVPCGAPTADV